MGRNNAKERDEALLDRLGVKRMSSLDPDRDEIERSRGPGLWAILDWLRKRAGSVASREKPWSYAGGALARRSVRGSEGTNRATRRITRNAPNRRRLGPASA